MGSAHRGWRIAASVLALTLLAVIADRGVAVAQRIEGTDAGAIERMLRHYENEGTVDEVVSGALRLLGNAPARFDEARERARLSGLLPVMRTAIRRGAGLGLTLRQSDTALTNGYTSDDSLTLMAQLSFRLDRLVFAPEESHLLGAASEARQQRWAFVETLVQLYFERRRLQLERDNEVAQGLQPDLPRLARIEQLGALLDIASDNALSRPARGRTARD